MKYFQQFYVCSPIIGDLVNTCRQTDKSGWDPLFYPCKPGYLGYVWNMWIVHYLERLDRHKKWKNCRVKWFGVKRGRKLKRFSNFCKRPCIYFIIDLYRFFSCRSMYIINNSATSIWETFRFIQELRCGCGTNVFSLLWHVRLNFIFVHPVFALFLYTRVHI